MTWQRRHSHFKGQRSPCTTLSRKFFWYKISIYQTDFLCCPIVCWLALHQIAFMPINNERCPHLWEKRISSYKKTSSCHHCTIVLQLFLNYDSYQSLLSELIKHTKKIRKVLIKHINYIKCMSWCKFRT